MPLGTFFWGKGLWEKCILTKAQWAAWSVRPRAAHQAGTRIDELAFTEGKELLSLCTLRCHEANPLTASLIFPRGTRMQGSYPARGLCITPTRGCSWALVGQSQGHGGIRHGGRRRRTRTTFQGPCSSLPGFPGATVVKSALANARDSRDTGSVLH